VELALDASEFAAGNTTAQGQIRGLRDSMLGLGESWMTAGRNMTLGVTAPLAGFAILSARTAAKAEELQSAFDQTFGDMSPMMNRWAKESGDALGRSTQEMQEMAKTFGVFFNQAAPTREAAASMSQDFSLLAQDLESFHDLDAGVALQKLRSGLAGESEPLRDFGVFLTAAAVEARALEMGLGGLSGEISEQDKILARYNLILEGTKNAQGDVERTSDSATNTARDFAASMTELQVAIGQRLLPVLTPLIKTVTSLVNSFTSLPSGVQTAIVAIAAVAAAIGPLMLIMGSMAALIIPFFASAFGPVGLAISAFINPLGTAISLLVQFAAKLGGLSILAQIGAVLLRFAGPIGVLVTLGALVYQNWDRIVEVFNRFKQASSEAIGPPLQRLIATLTEKFSELWKGPLGQNLKIAGAAVAKFGAYVSAALGNSLIRALNTLGEVFTGVFRQIGLWIDLVNALFKGDFAGAWGFAVGMVTNAVETILNALDALTGGGITYVRDLVDGVRRWMVTALNSIWSSVTDKIDYVKKAFFGLYDAVVGNSYIPDMVNGIAAEMARLDSVMVDPARRATQSVTEAARDMAREVKSLLDRLFPEIAAAQAQMADLALLDRAVLPDDVRAAARFRAVGGNVVPDVSFNTGPLDEAKQVQDAAKRVADAMRDQAAGTEEQTVRIAQSFKDMADDAISSLRGLMDAIKGGDFLGILSGVLGIGLQIAGIATGNANFAGNIPRFAKGTSSAPGGLALVGELGPELVNLPRGSQVIPNNELGGMGRQTNVQVIPSPYFNLVVDGRIQGAAPGIMQGSAAVAQSEMARRRPRRVA
jgi:hypothetical protein